MRLFVGLSIAILCSAIFLYSFTKDRSKYRNAYLLFMALTSIVYALTFLDSANQKTIVLYIVFLLGIGLFFVPVILIYEGMKMVKREGMALINTLSILLGLIIGIGEIATLRALSLYMPYAYYYEMPEYIAGLNRVMTFIGVSVLYGSMSFLIFMIYTLFLQVVPRKRDFDYLIVLGAGLIQGDKIGRLLAQRLDKAIKVYKKDKTPPRIIVSGGQGDDEYISEAQAMSNYLVDKGIPKDKILLESQSTTTMENVKFSKAILDSFTGRKYTAIITSNYHVYRALRYAKQVGLECTGIGSKVAFYYWPSALIREYVAFRLEKKHFVLFVLGWIVSLLFVWIIF